MSGPIELVTQPRSKAAIQVGFLTAAETSSNNNNDTNITSPPDARNNSLIVKPNSTRINWVHYPRMEEAVYEWDNRRPKIMRGNPYPLIIFHQWRSYPKPPSNTMYIHKNTRGIRLALALAKTPSFANTILNYSSRQKSELTRQTKALQPLGLLTKCNY